MRQTHLIAALQIQMLMCSSFIVAVEHPRAIHQEDYRACFAAILLEECDDGTYDLCRKFLNNEHLSYDEEREAIRAMADILERRHTDLSDVAVEAILAELEDKADLLEHNDIDRSDDPNLYDVENWEQTKSSTRSISSPVPGSQLAFGNGNIDGANIIGASKLQSDSGLTFDYDTGGSGGLTYDIQSNGTSIIAVSDSGLSADNISDNGSGNITLGNTLELAGNTVQSATTDSALTITQDSNSSDTTAESLTIETIDSSANNAVGNIILSSDSGNASPADIVFQTSTTERARINGSGLNVDNIQDNGSGNITANSNIDANGNTISSLAKATRDSANLTLETTTSGDIVLTSAGAIDASSNAINNVSTVNNDSANLRIETTTSGDVSIAPAGQINVNGAVINKASTIDGGTGTNVILKTATASDGSNDTKSITIDAQETESGDTANVALSAGATNGSVQVTNGNLDVQTGTLENTTGSLSVSTGSGDLSLSPSGNISASGNTISSLAKATRDSANLTLETTTSGDIVLTSAGAIDASSNAINNVSTVNNDSANLRLETTTSGDVSLDPAGNINVNSATISNTSTIDGGTGSSVTLQTATASDGSNDTQSISINASETENGDTANIDLNVGANNGNLKATNIKSGTGTALVLDSGNIVTDSSSKRFKKDITSCNEEIVDKVLKLEPSHFYRASTGEPEYGLIAEQVEEHIPELVTYENDDVTPHSIMYHRLAPLVLKAVQKQQATISAQEDLVHELYKAITSLQQQCSDLEDQVAQLKKLV